MKSGLHVSPFRVVSVRIYQPLHSTLPVLEASVEVILWECFSINLQSHVTNWRFGSKFHEKFFDYLFLIFYQAWLLLVEVYLNIINRHYVYLTERGLANDWGKL